METRAQGETVPDRQPGYLRCAKPSSLFSSLHEHFIYGIAIKSLAFEICTSMYILSHWTLPCKISPLMWGPQSKLCSPRVSEPHPECASSTFKSAHLNTDTSEEPVDPSQSRVFLPSPPPVKALGRCSPALLLAWWGEEGEAVTKDTDKRQAEEQQKSRAVQEARVNFREKEEAHGALWRLGQRPFKKGHSLLNDVLKEEWELLEKVPFNSHLAWLLWSDGSQVSGTSSLTPREKSIETGQGTSLVVQWLRIHLPMQGIQVQSLV